MVSMEVARKIKDLKVTTDADLLSDLKKSGEMTMSQLNNILIRLEILGLISVSWMDKDRRRIEYKERTPSRSQEEKA